MDEKAQNQRTSELSNALTWISIRLRGSRDLTIGKQQMVEIAKAVSHNLKVLILDEPTAALTDNEIEDLFIIMRDLASRSQHDLHLLTASMRSESSPIG